MSQQLTFGDQQLPCGGFTEEDKIIKNNMKILSQQQNEAKEQIIEAKNVSDCCGDDCATNSEQKNLNEFCKQTQISNKLQGSQQSQCCKQKQECCKQGKKSCNKKIQEKQQQKQNNKIKTAKTICKKCKLEPSALIHKNEPICRECLLKNIEYKCRLTLQNTMKVNGNSKVLVAFSGGLNSICLASILSSLKKRYQKHHLFGEIKCIHIQQQQAIPEGYTQMFQKESGIPLQIIKIEQIFEGQAKSFSDVKQIFSFFNKSANSADLLSVFRDRLIVNYARKHNFDFIVKGLNGESIAGSVFKYFAKGIGGDVTELSSNQPDSLYHFPLRQHLQKQLQYYFYTTKCSKFSLISRPDDLSYSCSTELDDHLNDFILNLQSMYSHTAPAITRTAEKIQSNRKNDVRCKWCMLKGALESSKMCRKCQRMYESKNKNFQNSKIPDWLKVQN